MKSKSQLVTLFKNVLIFAVCSFSSKIVSYIILPLYTSAVSDAAYGIIDLLTVVINLVVPVFSLCISDWLLRYVSRRKDDATKCFTIGLKTLFTGFVALSFFAPLLFLIPSIENYFVYILIGYLLSAGTLLITYFLRSIDRVYVMALGSIISALTTLLLTFVFYKYSILSINSFFICQFIGLFIGLLFDFLFAKLWRYFKRIEVTSEDKKEIKEFCLPLIPNSLFWWLNSSLDKMCIILLLGIGMSGRYSAASKIPSLLTIFATIFQQAWALLVYKQNSKSSNSSFEFKTFNAYSGVLCLGACVLAFLSKPIAMLLLKGEFFDSWPLISILVVAFVFSTLSTFIGTYFSANKNTKILLISSLISCLTNIIANFTLVPFFALVGAAIATCIASAVNFYIRLSLCIKYKYIKNSITLWMWCLPFVMLLTLSLSYTYFNNFILQISLISLIVLMVIILLIGAHNNASKHNNAEL